MDASDASMMERLKKLLVRYGNGLLKPCGSTDELLHKLDKLERILSLIIQDFKGHVEVALQPSKEALVANEFIRHAEMDVRVSVASCICEVIRIWAPEEAYDEDQMKEFFQLAISAFERLSCMSGRAYIKAVNILGTMSGGKSCVLMLDLQLHGLVHQMFHLFLNGITASHPDAIFSNMENIMTVIIHENDDCDESALELAKILLARLKKENQNVSPVAFRLAENTFKNCSNDLKTYLPEAVRCLGIPIEDYAEVVVSLFHDATQRENMESEDVAVDASCHAEASLIIDDGLSSLAESNKTENLQTDENFHENQLTTSHYCHEPENLGSPKQQQNVKEEDVSIRAKRSRKLNSLMKLEEGYDPLWMLGCCTSMRGSHCGSDKRKKLGHPLKHMVSEESPLSSRRGEEPSSAPISQKANMIKKHSGERQGSLSRIPLEKSRGKNIVSKDLKGEINAKNHLDKRQGFTEVASAKKSRGKTVISGDLTEEVLIKTLGSRSRPISSKKEALSGEVSIPHEKKKKSTTSKDKASKVRDASRCYGDELIGCNIKIWWPLDEMFYEGRITFFDELHKRHRVDYDDGVTEILDLAEECWQLIGDDNVSPHKEQKSVTAPSASTET